MVGLDLKIDRKNKNMEFARSILKEILESDQVEVTIQKYAHILNQNILVVIEEEKRQALSENDTDLADGLDGLSSYIQQTILKGAIK
jgi:hypothetical protein